MFFCPTHFFSPPFFFFRRVFFLAAENSLFKNGPMWEGGRMANLRFFQKKRPKPPENRGKHFSTPKNPPGTLNFVLEAFLKIRKNRTFWDFPGFPCKLTFEPFLAQFLGVSQKALGSIVGVFRRALEPNSPPKRSFAARRSFPCV